MASVRRRPQAGQILPLVAVIVMLAGVLALGIAKVGSRAVGRARAQSAADAAALAGVDGGAPAADRAAAADGATVVRFVTTPGGAFVEVRWRGEQAVAQAARGDAVSTAEAPAMRAALARAVQVTGGPVEVMRTDPNGLVVEVAPGRVGRLVALGAQAGLCPAAARPPGWFEICPTGAR
jgi:hypothetical protein